MFTLRKAGLRWLTMLSLASSVREVIAAWLLPLVLLLALVGLPSRPDETGAPSLAVAVRPLPHQGTPQTQATLPCEDEADDDIAENQGDAEVVHARTHPASDFEEC